MPGVARNNNDREVQVARGGGSEEGLLFLLRVPHRFRTDVRMRYSPSSPNSESEGVGPVNEKVPAQTETYRRGQ